MEDITKTGPKGLRGLQGLSKVNNMNEKELENYLNSFSTPNMNNIILDNAPTLTEDREFNTGVSIGDSMWDQEIYNQEEIEHAEDVRANNQWGIAKIGAGIGKGVVLAGTTFLDGTIGTIVGAINMVNAASKGKSSSEVRAAFWDNPFARAMKEINDWSEEALPNYMTNEERQNQENGEWYKNIWTANWWGNSFIKNLGFTAGAFATGNLVSGALKNAPRMVKSIVGSAVSAINEGKVEALNNATDWYDLEKQKLDDAYARELNELKQNYESSEMYPQLLANAQGTYEEALAKLNQDKAKVGNVDLALNIPILTASNFYMWGKLYAGGAKTAIRNSNIAMKNGKYVAKVLPTKVITGPISEGAEEMEQKIAATIPGLKYGSEVENFYMSKWDPEAAQDVLSWTKATMQGISETVGDLASWEEFTIGALTGAMGMPQFRSPKTSEGKWRSPVTIGGGIVGEMKDYREEKNRTQELVNRLNERVKSPEFRNYYQGMVRHTKYQNDMDNAAAVGDEFEYKNAEDSQLVSDLIMFDKAGRLNDLEEMINQAYDTSDDNIQAIIQNTTDANGNGPFSTEGNALSKEEVAQKLTETKDNILQTLKDYRASKDEINYNLNRAISGRKERTSRVGKAWNRLLDRMEGQDYISSLFNDDAVEELTWLNTKSKLWSKRFNSVADEVKQQLRTVVAEIEYRHPDKAEKVQELKSIVSMPNDLMASILGDPKNKHNMEVMAEIAKEISDSHNLEWQDLGQKMDDMVKLAKAKRQFNEKLDDYLNHPEKLKESLDKADSDIEEAATEEAKEKMRQDIVNAKSFSDLDKIDEDTPIDDNILNESPNQVAKDYRKAKIFKSELDKAIDDSDYNAEEKKALHDIANKRYSEEQSLADLMNSDLITESNNIVSSDGAVINGESLIPFLTIAKNNFDKRGEKTEEVKDNPNKSIVDNDTTGNDKTGTVPTGDKQKTAKLTDVINTSIDKETVNNIIIPLISEAEQSIRKAIISKEDDDISKANKDVNRLLDQIEGLPEASDPEFRQKIDNILSEIYSRLPEFNPDVSNNELLDSIEKDTENESIKGDINPNQYYRSSLTEYTVDSLKENKIDPKTNDYIPYIPSKNSIKIAQSKVEYDYINKGNIKVDDTIELKQETIEGDVFTFMYHNNHIVGVLPLATDTKYKGIEGVNTRLSKGEKVTLTVSKVMLGRFRYTRNETRTVRDVASLPSDLKFGIMRPVKGRLGMVTNTEDVVEPVYDELHSDGKVYMLLPNSRGTLSPKLLRVKHFNREEFPLGNLRDSGNTRAVELDTILNEIAKADNPDQITDLFVRLGKVLHLSNDFHMNLVPMDNNIVLTIRSSKAGRKNIVIQRGSSGAMTLGGDGSITYDQPTRTDTSEIYNQVLDYLYNYNPPFNIQSSKINKGDYNTNLLKDDILYTHITDAEMIGSWFTTTWYDDNGVEQKAVNPRGQFNPANNKTGTRIMLGGKQYYVDKGVVYDVNENEVTENTKIIKDLAWVYEVHGNRMNGDNLDNGRAILPSGKGIDIIQQRYLTNTELKNLQDKIAGRPSMLEKANSTMKKLQEDYNKVKRDDSGRPDTSENENGESVYRILEEDGQYHEYKRVHSVIGSNWIDEDNPSQETLERRAKSSANALKWGNMFGDFWREFLKDKTVIKFNEMLEIAFSTLMAKLKQVKANLEANGEKFLVNRIVVFKKYPDGTRVAGELDALAYNAITGTFSIYDFKTSKRTFHASGNAVDLYRVAGNRQTRSDFEQHSLQLSAYKNMFDSSYDSTIGSLAIMPFVINYTESKSLNQITPERGIAIPYNPAVPIGTTKDVQPVVPPVTNPTNAVLEPKSVNILKKKVYYIEGATSYDDEWHVLIKPIQIFWQNYKRDPQIGETVREQYKRIAPVIGKVRESGIKHNYEEVAKALKGTYYEEVLQYIKVKEELSSTSNPTLQVAFNEGDKVTYTINGETGTGTVVKVSSTGKTITVKRDKDGKEVGYASALLSKIEASTLNQSQDKSPKLTSSKETSSDSKKILDSFLEKLFPMPSPDSQFYELNKSTITRQREEVLKGKKSFSKKDKYGNYITISFYVDEIKRIFDEIDKIKKERDKRALETKGELSQDEALRGPESFLSLFRKQIRENLAGAYYLLNNGVTSYEELETKKVNNRLQDSQKGETSYFELNGEVVTGPTTVIGNAVGYEIRMYKHPIETKGLGGSGGGVLYDYYAVFPNGDAERIIRLQNLPDAEAGRMIIAALNGNPAKTKQYAERITKVGSYINPESKENSLRDAMKKLEATNKQVDRGEANVAEKPAELNPQQSQEPKSDLNPEVYKDWDDLSDATQQVLELGGYTSNVWNFELDTPGARQAALNCLGI